MFKILYFIFILLLFLKAKIVDSLGYPVLWMALAGFMGSVGCFGLIYSNPIIFFGVFGISVAIRIACLMPSLVKITQNLV